MFYYIENTYQKAKLEKLFKKVKAIYKTVPPQIEWLGNIEAQYLEDFLKSVLRLTKHPNINPDLFGFIRLHIAFKEDYEYCKNFNTTLLHSKGYSQKELDDAITDIYTVPFDKKHKLLAQKAIKAIYASKTFGKEDFETLFSHDWTQKDIFDAIEHAGTIFRNGRILTAYTLKESKYI